MCTCTAAAAGRALLLLASTWQSADFEAHASSPVFSSHLKVVIWSLQARYLVAKGLPGTCIEQIEVGNSAGLEAGTSYPVFWGNLRDSHKSILRSQN